MWRAEERQDEGLPELPESFKASSDERALKMNFPVCIAKLKLISNYGSTLRQANRAAASSTD